MGETPFAVRGTSSPDSCAPAHTRTRTRVCTNAHSVSFVRAQSHMCASTASSFFGAAAGNTKKMRTVRVHPRKHECEQAERFQDVVVVVCALCAQPRLTNTVNISAVKNGQPAAAPEGTAAARVNNACTALGYNFSAARSLHQRGPPLWIFRRTYLQSS